MSLTCTGLPFPLSSCTTLPARQLVAGMTAGRSCDAKYSTDDKHRSITQTYSHRKEHRGKEHRAHHVTEPNISQSITGEIHSTYLTCLSSLKDNSEGDSRFSSSAGMNGERVIAQWGKRRGGNRQHDGAGISRQRHSDQTAVPHSMYPPIKVVPATTPSLPVSRTNPQTLSLNLLPPWQSSFLPPHR